MQSIVDRRHVSVPYQAPPPTILSILTQLDGRTGGNGGAATVPTDATVAASSIPDTISNNLAASVQQANAATPYVTVLPMPTVTPPQVLQNQIQTASIQIPQVIAMSTTPTVTPPQVPQDQIPPVVGTSTTPSPAPAPVPQNQIPAVIATSTSQTVTQPQVQQNQIPPVIAPSTTPPPASPPYSAPRPPTVTPREYQYLSWGYWARQIRPWGSNPTNDFRGIKTWIAGRPTVNMPTSGTASFNGAAIGTVTNNNAKYLAAGNFNNTYNFGNNSGKITINNFDGKNFSGPVTGAKYSCNYSGYLSGTNLSGVTSGSFYRPNATETGGLFSIHSTVGPSYLASGTFTGK